MNDIRVSGAGSDVVNGVYRHTSMIGGKPYYETEDENYGIQWTTLVGGYWFIASTSGGTYYRSSEDVATPDLVETWEAYDIGVVPLPTVEKIAKCPLLVFIKAFKEPFLVRRIYGITDNTIF